MSAIAFTLVIPDVSFLGHEWQELGREATDALDPDSTSLIK